MTTAQTQTNVYTRSQAVVFAADNVLNALRDIIRENGLNPITLANSWESGIGLGVRTWMTSGHLTKIVIEFYRPNATVAMSRWDFPITYSGIGVDDDMWSDRTYLQQLVAKAPKPSSDCIYRVLLDRSPGFPPVQGLVDTQYLSTGSMTPRQAGTIIATGHVIATASYWK